MTYQTSPFGNRGDSSNVLSDVHNHYNQRNEGGTIGIYRTAGKEVEITIDLTGEMLNQANPVLVEPVLPVGAVITSVYLQTEEVFALGGTSPAVEIGTQGSEATNGVTVSEANLESVQTLDLTSALSGTWASPIATAATVDIALSGTSPTVDAALGKARVTITYVLA